MKMNYDLICMSFDGAFVIDSSHKDLESAFNRSANIGSNWYFYPFHFFVKGKTVKETGEGLVNMKTKKAFMPAMFRNKRLASVVKSLQKSK